MSSADFGEIDVAAQYPKNKIMILQANPANITKAAEMLEAGGVGAFPTETVYGLGADVFNVRAVAKIFEVKKRPVFDPLIVHVESERKVHEVAAKVPQAAKELMKRFWPGPLTLVLPKKIEVPDLVTSGLDTVAVRVPSHPAAQKLIRALKSPIAAPSANRFGRTSTTDAASVDEEFGEEIDFVLDGGACRVGVESTIVKFDDKTGQVTVLRPGGVSIDDLQRALPKTRIVYARAKAAIEAPGQMDEHYATQTPLIYLKTPFSEIHAEIEKLCADFKKKKGSIPRMGFLGWNKAGDNKLFPVSRVLTPAGKPAEAASRLFGSMRDLDRQKLKFIVAEGVSPEGLGLAIDDRLTRAATARDLAAVLKRLLK
jgi:L-threonylcarbamoyladenylate synthase